MPLHQPTPRTLGETLRDNRRTTGLDAAMFARLTPSWGDRTQESAPKNSSPATVIVKDPTAPTNGPGRQFLYRYDEHRELETLSEAHKAESLLTQATDKYTDLINKEDFDVHSVEAGPADFIRARLRWISGVTKTPFETLIKESTRDFVEYANFFWVKSRLKPDVRIVVGGKTLRSAKSLHGKDDLGVIGGYFRADPKTMHPVYNEKNGRLRGWEQRVPGREPLKFNTEQVLHFAYKPPAGKVLGVSMYGPVLDDIRALREVEDYVMKLLVKHLFPLIHHEIPDRAGDGLGSEEDVQNAVANYATMAPDGMIITPPGVKINVVETKAGSMDAGPYLKHLLQRVLMGLGLSEAIMGLGSAAAGMSDMLTAQMHDRVKSFQQDIERLFNLLVVTELLVEAGFDPINREKDIAEMEFREIELESVVRMQNHAADMFSKGGITEDEYRHEMKKNPLTAKERKLLYIYTDKIPVIEAQVKAELQSQKELATHQNDLAKDLANHQSGLEKDAATHQTGLAKDLATHSGKIDTHKTATAAAAAAGKPLPKTLPAPGTLRVPKLARRSASLGLNPTRSASGGSPDGAVGNKNNPANQHGRRGAPRFSKQPAAGVASRNRPKSAS